MKRSIRSAMRIALTAISLPVLAARDQSQHLTPQMH